MFDQAKATIALEQILRTVLITTRCCAAPPVIFFFVQDKNIGVSGKVARRAGVFTLKASTAILDIPKAKAPLNEGQNIQRKMVPIMAKRSWVRELRLSALSLCSRCRERTGECDQRQKKKSKKNMKRNTSTSMQKS